MVDLSVSNVVGGGSLQRELDLSSIAETNFESFETRYDPESLAAVIFSGNNIESEGPTIMLYRSGKFSIAGGKSINETKRCFNVFCSDIIKRTGLNIHPYLEIRFLVTTGDIGRSINLSAAAIALGMDETEYEPEQFPGLFYRPKSEDWFIILFSSGSVVVDGIPDMDILESGYKYMKEILSENNI